MNTDRPDVRLFPPLALVRWDVPSRPTVERPRPFVTAPTSASSFPPVSLVRWDRRAVTLT